MAGNALRLVIFQNSRLPIQPGAVKPGRPGGIFPLRNRAEVNTAGAYAEEALFEESNPLTYETFPPSPGAIHPLSSAAT